MMRLGTRWACRLLLCLAPVQLLCGAPLPDAARRAADFRQFCEFVGTEYAYFDRKATDWQGTCDALAPAARNAKSRDAFIGTLETALAQLYDTHAHLGTNTDASLRLVPTGSQLRLAWREGRAFVTDVRRDSAAEQAGIRAGDEVIDIDGVPVSKAIAPLEPRHLLRADPLARDWALNVAVAGRHAQKTRRLRLDSPSGSKAVEYDADATGSRPGLLESRRIGDVGYVRIHNSLGNDALVTTFDSAIGNFTGVSGLILDLRDTPSGGTSSVARGIMGHLVATASPYQRHEYVAEGRQTGVPRVWVEYVTPRPPMLAAPLVILVGAWTGSMGEGIAIGLNGARSAPVLGQRMAHLLGALGETRLEHFGFAVRVPNEKLFHVDGSEREDFVPRPVGESSAADPALDAALQLITQGNPGGLSR